MKILKIIFLNIFNFIKIIYYDLIPQINFENYESNLEKFTNQISELSSFCKKGEFLWKILNKKIDKNNYEISKLLEEIRNERNNLEKINFDKRYFNISFYIDILKKEEDEYSRYDTNLKKRR